MVLLNSKTTIPPLSDAVIHRSRITALLQASQMKRAFIICAPAGYGKTTLLSETVRNVKGSVAWVSIDALDNDTTSYIQYLLHSISEALSLPSDTDFFQLLSYSPQKPLELLIDTLLNELSKSSQDLHIVFDDFHLIENPIIHQMVARMIQYLPPNCFIYISSRTAVPLPLAKWRVNGWLIEIGIEELRFTIEELKELNRIVEILPNDSYSLQQLMDSTEGWIAGIHLASLSKESYSTVEDEKAVRMNADLSFIKDFLVDEILETLPPDLKDFLLKTSILERLDPAVCTAITNVERSEQTLARLERKGLFILRVNSQLHIYRYHPLFAEALRRELRINYTAKEISNLYVQTATYLRKHVHNMAAIELLMEGREYLLAEQWMYEHLVTIFEANQTGTLVRWVTKLLQEKVYVHIETRVMYAFLLALNHNTREASLILEGLAKQHEQDQWMFDPELYTVVRGFVTVKVYCLIVLGENPEQAIALIKSKVDGGLIPSRWDSTPIWFNQYEPKVLRTSIGSRGKLWKDEQMKQFFNLFRNSGFKEQNMTGFSYAIRAETLYEWNRIDETLPEIEEAIRFAYQFQDSGLFTPMYLLQSRIAIVKGDYISAQSILDHALSEVTEWYWLRSIYAMKAYCALVEGNIEQADAYLSAVKAPSELSTELGQSLWLLMKARILLAKGDNQEALKLVVLVQAKALQEDQISTMLEAIVLKAACHYAMEEERIALSTLHEALQLAGPYNYIRTFMDEATIAPLLTLYYSRRRQGVNLNYDNVDLTYVEQLFENKAQIDESPLKNLSSRELEVLKLLAKGYTNRQIGEELALKESTIRVYLTTIYQKLHVRTRAQAIIKINQHLI